MCDTKAATNVDKKESQFQRDSKQICVSSFKYNPMKTISSSRLLALGLGLLLAGTTAVQAQPDAKAGGKGGRATNRAEYSQATIAYTRDEAIAKKCSSIRD